MEASGDISGEQPLVGWSREAGLLADLFDRLTALMASERVKPYPRPKTAIDRLRADQVLARHKARVRMIAPRPS